KRYPRGLICLCRIKQPLSVVHYKTTDVLLGASYAASVYLIPNLVVNLHAVVYSPKNSLLLRFFVLRRVVPAPSLFPGRSGARPA
ncbi:MAG TPA: hypothetical protein VHR86_05860, partial [Armatimonadota bacterium]|nr:hypothetical protein [Armatimonadota bacterium]